MAQRCAQLGANLALYDYQEAAVNAALATLPQSTRVFSRCFDVSRRDAVQAFSQAVHSHLGRLDVVINNAGVALNKSFAKSISPDDFEWIFGINFGGMVYGCQSFMPLLAQQQAALVNISSLFGLLHVPMQSAYCASKMAIRGYWESLALEQKAQHSPLRVMTVYLGGIRTNIVKSTRYMDAITLRKFEHQLITSAPTPPPLSWRVF